MLERHCADARFVWNLAFEWLAAGSSSVQQQEVTPVPGVLAQARRPDAA
jgi:hypothetical protein